MIKRFTYTKPNGEVSERRVVVVSEPKEMYLTLDVSSLSSKEVADVMEIVEQSRAYLRELLNSRGYDTLWRNFKPENMSEIVDEDTKRSKT